MDLVAAITLMLLQASFYSCRTLRPVSLIHDGSSEVTLVSSGRITSKLAQMIPILEGLDSSDSKITKIKKLIPVYDKLNKWNVNKKKALVDIMPSVKKRKPFAYIISDGGNKFMNAAAGNKDNSAASFGSNHTAYQSSHKNSHSQHTTHEAKHKSTTETKHASSHEKHLEHNEGKRTHGLIKYCKQHSVLCDEEGLNPEKNDESLNTEKVANNAAEYVLKRNDFSDDSDFIYSFETDLAISAEVSESDSDDIESPNVNMSHRKTVHKFNLLSQKENPDALFESTIPELEEFNHKHHHHSHHNLESHTDKHKLANDEDNAVYLDSKDDHSKNNHIHIKKSAYDKPMHQHSKENGNDSEFKDVKSETNNANSNKLNSYASNDIIYPQNWQSEEILKRQHHERHSQYVPEMHHSLHHTTSPNFEHSSHSHSSHGKKHSSEQPYEENFVGHNSLRDIQDDTSNNAKSVELPTYESASDEIIDSDSASSSHSDEYFWDPESNESDLNLHSDSSLSDSELNESSSILESLDSKSTESDPKSRPLESESNESDSKYKLSDSGLSESDSNSSSSDSESDFDVIKSDLESRVTNSASDSSESEHDFNSSDAISSSNLSDSESTESSSNLYNSAANNPEYKDPNSDSGSSDSEADPDLRPLSSTSNQESDDMNYPSSSESRSIESDPLSSETNTESIELDTKSSDSNAELSESIADTSESNEQGSISKPTFYFDSYEPSSVTFSDMSPETFSIPSQEIKSSFNPALELSKIYHKDLESFEDQQLNELDLKSLTSDIGSVITKFGTRKFNSELDFDNTHDMDDLLRDPVSSVAATRRLNPRTRTKNIASLKACNPANNQDLVQLGSKAEKKSYKLSFIFYR